MVSPFSYVNHHYWIKKPFFVPVTYMTLTVLKKLRCVFTSNLILVPTEEFALSIFAADHQQVIVSRHCFVPRV